MSGACINDLRQVEQKEIANNNNKNNNKNKNRRRRRQKQRQDHRKQVQRGKGSKARTKLLYQQRINENAASDNNDFGDMMTRKPKDCFRIQFQNQNGWRTKNEYADVDEACYYSRQSQTDCLMIAEHCLSLEKPIVLKKVKSKVQRHLKKSTLVHSVSKIHYDSDYKPGSTATILAGK